MRYIKPLLIALLTTTIALAHPPRPHDRATVVSLQDGSVTLLNEEGWTRTVPSQDPKLHPGSQVRYLDGRLERLPDFVADGKLSSQGPGQMTVTCRDGQVVTVLIDSQTSVHSHWWPVFPELVPEGAHLHAAGDLSPAGLRATEVDFPGLYGPAGWLGGLGLAGLGALLWRSRRRFVPRRDD